MWPNRSFLRVWSHLLKKSLMENLYSVSTFAPWKGQRGSWKIYFPVKNGFSVKNLFWAILGPKMMVSLNSECNIRMRTSVHLCKFVSSSQGYQKYSRRLFYIYRQTSRKNFITFWSHTRFFIRKPFFRLNLNFLNIMLEIGLNFS